MTTEILLRSFAHLPDSTLSVVDVPSVGFQCFAIERPWKDNRPFMSCVPAGTYDVVWDRSGRRRNVPMLKDVPGRTFIEIHPATWSRQLQGCIALGMGIACQTGTVVPYLTETYDAQQEFLRALGIAQRRDLPGVERQIGMDDGGDYVWAVEREREIPVRVAKPSNPLGEPRTEMRRRKVPSGSLIEHNEPIGRITVVRECHEYPQTPRMGEAPTE